MTTREDTIAEFEKNTLEEYESARRVNRFCNIESVNQTDGNFVQIGLRPQLDKDIFDPNLSIFRGIIGLSHKIALGEENYFVSNILRNATATSVNLTDIDLNYLNQRIADLNSTNVLIMLVPVWFKYDHLLRNLNAIRYDNNLSSFTFNLEDSTIQVFSVSDKILGDNIILFEKESVHWRYKVFNDKPLDIKINSQNLPYDVLVRVLIKQELDLTKIRVLKVIR